jgi:hypothetical protein
MESVPQNKECKSRALDNFLKCPKIICKKNKNKNKKDAGEQIKLY